MAERKPFAPAHHQHARGVASVTTAQTIRRKWRWLRHVAWGLTGNVLLVIIAVVVFFGSGAGNPFLRRLAIRRIDSITGGRAEIRSLSIQWLSLRATVKGFVLH